MKQQRKDPCNSMDTTLSRFRFPRHLFIGNNIY
ncbi:unnamed protein product, partial [Larinioides sclopetarius]